jgi:hypothetical protein
MFLCPNADDGTEQPHDEFIAFPGNENDDPEGLGIIVYADGTVSNRRGDGVMAYSPNDAMAVLADDETEVVCAYCGAHVAWQHETSGIPEQKGETQ